MLIGQSADDWSVCGCNSNADWSVGFARGMQINSDSLPIDALLALEIFLKGSRKEPFLSLSLLLD